MVTANGTLDLVLRSPSNGDIIVNLENIDVFNGYFLNINKAEEFVCMNALISGTSRFELKKLFYSPFIEEGYSSFLDKWTIKKLQKTAKKQRVKRLAKAR